MIKHDGEFWKRVTDEYRAGGVTQAELASRHRVTVARLKYHLYVTRESKPVSTNAFLPVRVSEPASATVEIQAGAVLVRVPAAAGAAYVSELVRALSAC
jgi:hypothetical protein